MALSLSLSLSLSLDGRLSVYVCFALLFVCVSVLLFVFHVIDFCSLCLLPEKRNTFSFSPLSLFIIISCLFFVETSQILNKQFVSVCFPFMPCSVRIIFIVESRSTNCRLVEIVYHKKKKKRSVTKIVLFRFVFFLVVSLLFPCFFQNLFSGVFSFNPDLLLIQNAIPSRMLRERERERDFLYF